MTVAEASQPVCALVYIAVAKGFFESRGIAVTLVPFNKGKLALDTVLGGKADVATVAETPLVHVAFQNQPVVILGTIETATKNTKCVARRDRGILRPADLRGKRLGVPLGGNAEYFMDKLLATQEIKRADVTVVNLNPPEMAGALTRGDIDASFTWEPHVTRVVQQLGEKAIVFDGDGLYRETFNVVSMRSWADQNPILVRKLLEGLLDAERFAKANRAQAIEITAKRIQMTPEELDRVWGYYSFDLVLDHDLVKLLTDEARWAIDARVQQPPMPDYSKMIYSRPLAPLAPSAVRLQQ